MKNKIVLSVFISIFLIVFSLFIYAITFRAETYVEIVPAIKGTVCLDEGNGCVTDTDKEILFGMTFVYPSQEESYRAAMPIPLVFFDGKMYRGTGGGGVGLRDEEGDLIPGKENLSAWRMSTLNPDGTEIHDTAEIVYAFDAKTASISDFTMTIDGEEYSLKSIERIRKISGTILSDDFTFSDDLLTAKFFCEGEGVLTITRDADTGVEETSIAYGAISINPADGLTCYYNLIGSGDATATVDFGDGTTEEVFPTFYDIPKSHFYQQDGTYTASLRLTYPSGEETIIRKVQITVDSSTLSSQFSTTESVVYNFDTETELGRITISSNPVFINSGEMTSITFDSTYGDTCFLINDFSYVDSDGQVIANIPEAENMDANKLNIGTSGTLSLKPKKTTVYQLDCYYRDTNVRYGGSSLQIKVIVDNVF